MERTESVVVQVAPDYENDKIQEMQGFGWNLQGRQEVHQEGEAYGRPSLSGDSYIVKRTVHSYVKLHLVRSSALPNLDQLKSLEAEYSSLPFKSVPTMRWPGCFTAFGGLGLLVAPSLFFQEAKAAMPAPVFMIVMYGAWVALGILWIRSRRKKQDEAREVCQRSLARMGEIRKEAATLLH